MSTEASFRSVRRHMRKPQRPPPLIRRMSTVWSGSWQLSTPSLHAALHSDAVLQMCFDQFNYQPIHNANHQQFEAYLSLLSVAVPAYSYLIAADLVAQRRNKVIRNVTCRA